MTGLLHGGFMPHGHCYLWDPRILWIHVVADGLIALAYYSIPIALVYFVRRRPDTAFHWMFLMFGAFIFLCGTTHVMNIWTIWEPAYWLEGGIKAATALVSLGTAVVLWPLIPRALALPSPAKLEAANAELRRQVMERRQAEDRAHRMNLELEQRVRARTLELERSNQELRQFAHVASHDLQEPLRMVSSYTELLARRYRSRLDPEADAYIHHAVEGSKRMHELVNDLLAYAHVDTADRAWEAVDSGQALGQVVADLAMVIEETGAVVTHGPLPRVRADASQLRQVFQNLIGNALKFAGDRPPRIDVRAERERGAWKFSVSDSGIGLSHEHAERIFVLFQRLHGPDQYPGTGIGLAICKKIVDGHGGRIWVKSAPGRGCTFYFTLPAEAAQA